MKICARCKKEKDYTEFYKNKSFPDGLDSYCKGCKRIITKRYRDKTRDEQNKKRREKRKNDKNYRDKIREQKRKSYWNNVEKRLFYSNRSRAKRKGIKFELSIEDIKVPKYCPVLEVELDKNNFSPTLDRIYPELGYIPGNVKVISKRANTMKNNGSYDQLQKFSKNIIKYMHTFEDIVQTAENNKSVD